MLDQFSIKCLEDATRDYSQEMRLKYAQRLLEEAAYLVSNPAPATQSVEIPDSTIEKGDVLRIPIKNSLSFNVTTPEVKALKTLARWFRKETGHKWDVNSTASCVMVAALAHPREVIGWLMSAIRYSTSEGMAAADVCAARVESCPDYRRKTMPRF